MVTHKYFLPSRESFHAAYAMHSNVSLFGILCNQCVHNHCVFMKCPFLQKYGSCFWRQCRCKWKRTLVWMHCLCKEKNPFSAKNQTLRCYRVY